ncbi:MAG: hypothetical protein ABII97_02890 [Patescibacteria group bacterium]
MTLQNIRVGIVGVGMVGTPLMNWFLSRGYILGRTLFCYDNDGTKGFSDKKHWDLVTKAHLLFVCVPTPSRKDGSCNVDIIKSIIEDLPDRNRAIVIKSTVPPTFLKGLATKYKKRGVFLFNPEFLTEKQAERDFLNPVLQIVAPVDDSGKPWTNVILDILPKAYFQSPLQVENTYTFYGATAEEAAEAKYAINRFGAMKVTFFVILYLRCKILRLDFKNVWRLVTKDPRVGDSWAWALHGEILGYNGFCFPKDVMAWISESRSLLKKISDQGLRRVFSRGIDFFDSMGIFNEEVHRWQGTTVEEMSIHDVERDKKIEKK